jgi:hypothetical protein
MEEITPEAVFEVIKNKCNPKNMINWRELVGSFFNIRQSESNFSGGCGDEHRTTHENMFALMNPDLQAQVVFGTDKGGRSKYLSNRYTVDFYDQEKKIAYEIDGSNHAKELQHLKDRLKAAFLWEVYGIKTIRITNQNVEAMVMKRLVTLHEEGKLECLLTSIKSA